MHDDVMPAVGRAFATFDGQLVSTLQLSDDEVKMRDRVERFLMAPHASDWFYDTAVELQRTRIVSRMDTQFRVARYYKNLMGTHYASSRTRYETVAADIRADEITLPATFKAVCAVRETDRRRSVAAAGIDSITRREQRAVADRTAENEGYIAWFVRALGYRYRAYNYALDHLLIAAPDAEARTVNALLNTLAVGVGQAQRGEFCAPVGRAAPAMASTKSAVPSRFEGRPYDLGPRPAK